MSGPALITTEQTTADVFSKSTAKDYSGETAFAKLSAEQKLCWLSQAAYFVWVAKGKVMKES